MVFPPCCVFFLRFALSAIEAPSRPGDKAFFRAVHAMDAAPTVVAAAPLPWHGCAGRSIEGLRVARTTLAASCPVFS
jgi:hypothetical protein